MPVEDKPVHELTRLKTKTHGCNNKPLKAGYWAPDREYHVDGSYTQTQRWIPHTMTKDCQWRSEHESPRCEGCAK